ncbi:MAG: SdpI family protein [Candidatus Altiarchaeota archaeon]|nr:SdpI family protein [Candidatus Altiarchaeota archaeon]
MTADAKTLISLALVILSFTLSFYAYPISPDRVATHWNVKGEVDGYMGKTVGLFLIPSIMAALIVFFKAIPKIDPLKKNITLFTPTYKTFTLALTFFMCIIHIQSVLWNLGIKLSFNATMPVLVSGLFYVAGDLMDKSKRNWFIGVRTPWTLSSDKVWDKTNKLGGKLFKASAVTSIVGIVFLEYWLYFLLVPVFASAAYLFLYSYLEYRKETEK